MGILLPLCILVNIGFMFFSSGLFLVLAVVMFIAQLSWACFCKVEDKDRASTCAMIAVFSLIIGLIILPSPEGWFTTFVFIANLICGLFIASDSNTESEETQEPSKPKKTEVWEVKKVRRVRRT